MSEAYSPIPELNLLKEFEDRIGPVYYSEGFELRGYGADSGLHTWSEHPEFLSRFIPFAQANHSGSDYALWRCDDRTDLAALPVVLVGDEGHLYVIARDLKELFQLLAIDFWPSTASPSPTSGFLPLETSRNTATATMISSPG
jgi:hypothetical protein